MSRTKRKSSNRIVLLGAIATYGMSCHICGLPMFPHGRSVKRGTDPLAPTADHIIPRKMGGRTTDENIKAAHKFCNEYRGDSDITDQLRDECRKRIQELTAARHCSKAWYMD